MPLWLRQSLWVALLTAILFGSAGRLDLPWFWGIVAVHAVALAIGMRTVDPDLIRERMRPGPGGRDRNLRLVALPLYLAHLIVAGLDVGRFGWSGAVPVAVQGVALSAYAAGMGLSTWAMSINRFFSPVVRIQRERGHHLVTGGPYRYLRHPGYAAGLIASLSGGIALGSWWSLLPMVPIVLLILRRTALEDRLLHADLEGYRQYAERVRYRLVPGVW